MKETLINPIGSVRPPDSGISPKMPVSAHADTAASHESAVTPTDRSAKQTEATSSQSGSGSDVSIHFRLDDKTNELTVFVVDRQTKRVLRSIPASELHKLQAGELLKLTA